MNNYPLDFIENICNNIGPRLPGSKNEEKAGQYIKKELEKYCDEIKVEEFYTPILKKFVLLKISTAFFLISAIYYIISPIFSFIMILLYVVFMGLLIIYPEIIDNFLPKKKSYNIIGVKKAKKTGNKKVVFSAHHDSGYVMPLFEKSKNGFFLLKFNMIISLFSILIIVANFLFGYKTIWLFYYLIFSGIIQFYISTNINSKKKSLGANDNLSSVATILNIAKNVKNQKNVDLMFISFGSEEAGCVGSQKFVRKNYKDIKNSININFESVGCGDYFGFLKSEKFGRIKYDYKNSDKFSSIIKKNDGKIINKNIGQFGKSDGGSFAKSKIKSICIIGTNKYGHIPNWHSINDVFKNIKPKNIDILTKSSLEYISSLQNKQ
ncbi:M28 family peptidase [archaeon]|jgi:hypothetical protein|nr:M28 family peptidase [archaeon]MBT4647763.1 M28 family peptidase [archaeon]MBT6821624.1 M28 family peptidase [archaeon]MBT7391848.1 M28 family peptidase [archaeon]